MAGALWIPEIYADESGHEPLVAWLGQLSSVERAAAGAAIRTFLRQHGPDVVSIGMGRRLRRGLFEFYVEQDAEALVARFRSIRRPTSGPSEEVRLRIFCHAHGDRRILMLTGLNKGRKGGGRRQSRAIHDAVKMLDEWKRRHRS